MTERTHTWNYFNGREHGWHDKNGYHPPQPMTRAYCSACAPSHIPGWNLEAPYGTEHYATKFRCAPWRAGRACDGCGKDI